MHTFLFQEARWQAEGIYKDDLYKTIEVSGESVIIHSSDAWISTSVMRLMSDPPLEYENRYEIVPFTDGCDAASWTSDNSVLGKLSGHFTVFDDSILSVYQTADGNFRGSEFLMMQDCRRYLNRGVLFKGKSRLSSWMVALTRTD